jgi:heme-degrading monooxygenase HmoA
MFVALSKFAVANGMGEDVKQAFRARPHLVESADGFIRLDVLSPIENPSEIWLITYWSDAASFDHWHKSHLYKNAHTAIPKGLKLIPKSATLAFFDHVSS